MSENGSKEAKNMLPDLFSSSFFGLLRVFSLFALRLVLFVHRHPSSVQPDDDLTDVIAFYPENNKGQSVVPYGVNN